MAWIESVTGIYCNTDTAHTITCLIDGNDNTYVDINYGVDEFYRLACFAKKDYGKDRMLAQNLAQIARGNAYISQGDIRRMMNDLN